MTETEENVNEEQAPDETAEEAAPAEAAPAAAEESARAGRAALPQGGAQARALDPRGRGSARSGRSRSARRSARSGVPARRSTGGSTGRSSASAARRSRAPRRPPPRSEKPEGTLKVRQGIVVSDKADKTITVRIDVAHRHRMYKKIVRTSSTLHAHDEANDAHVGDTVRLIESRPISRTKRWRLVEVVERAR